MTATPAQAGAEIGVIGGSGFYAFLDDVVELAIDTPFGSTSDPIVVGDLAGRRVAFVARHGRDHRFPPHRVPYRANLWALAELGVGQILAPCAVGSLQSTLGPGAVVIPDQLVDRTIGRVQTFHEHFPGPPAHAEFADPYCPDGRATVLRVAPTAVDGGTMVVIEGPRFSTRAESRWHAAQGWSLVNMTGHPEAVLARELGLCYTAVALVTDYDAGVDGGAAVTADEVFRVFGENVAHLRDVLTEVVPALPVDRTCPCAGRSGGAVPHP